MSAWRCASAAIVLALLAVCTAGPTEAAVVERRGTADHVQGAVVSAGPAGLVLRVQRKGIERQETVLWSDIRAVEFEEGEVAVAGLDAWLAAGESLWRARTRVLRGDWPFALTALKQAGPAWLGAAPCEDGLAASLALTHALVTAGNLQEALVWSFEAMRHARAGVQPPEWAAAALAHIDSARGVPVAIPPMALDSSSAAASAAALRAWSAGSDAPLSHAAGAYAAALDGGALPTADRGVRSTNESNQGIALFSALRESKSSDEATRAQARRNLQGLRNALPPWADVWIRYALGESLLLESNVTSKERGAILLVSVEAVDPSAHLALATSAHARVERAVKALQSVTGPVRAAGTVHAGAVRVEDAVPRDMAEGVTQTLESMGHTDLLATHLETQLETARTDEDRANIVARLALLLAGRLESEPDAATRDALLSRSTRVVDRFDEGSEPLRMVLLRSQHRAAQRVTEDRRAGRATDEAAQAASVQFKQLVRSFDALSKRSDAARHRTEGDVSRAAGLQAELLAERASQQEQVARSSQFFQAWALYYHAWLMRELGQSGWNDVAAQSLTAFARLIEPGQAAVNPSEVSVDLRSNEGFASAVLGSALVSSLVQTGSTADAWLELLEAPGTHESVRLKLPAWRMASLLDRGEFARALELLKTNGDGPQGGPMALIAAARAARDSSVPGSAELLTEAVARIASAGRLSDLAAMTGVAQAVHGGAGAGLFEGVRLAALAQRLQQEGSQADATKAWGDAAKALQDVLSLDAPPAIAAGARALQGWALRGAGKPAEAAEAFIASAQASSGDRAADTLWNAVLCLDEAARKGDGGAALRADELVNQVVSEHPKTAAAVRGHAWRVVHSRTPDVGDIDALLAPSTPADLAPAARKAAVEGLYRRFRSLQGDERLAAARRALAVSDGEPVSAGDEGTAELRRRLEMAVDVSDRGRAADALAATLARTGRDPELARALNDELAARRAQIAALGNRAADAIIAAQSLEPSAVWGRVAWRAAGEALTRDTTASAAQRAMVARAVVLGWPDTANAPSEDLVAWCAAESALLTAAEQTGDPAGAAQALAAARKSRPRDADLAMADAELRWARGDRPGSAEVLRELLAQVEAGSAVWFSAKLMQVQSLAGQDPVRARQVLEQVRSLANGFGSGPTAQQFLVLDQKLPRGAP